MKNYYSILGIEQTDNMDQIKKTYRKLTMLYHPDKNCNNSTFTEKCKEINEAYDILGDKDKKKQYDYELNNYNIYSNIGMFNIPNNSNINTNTNTNTNRRFYKVNNLLNQDDIFNLFSNLNSYNNQAMYDDYILQDELFLEKERLEKERLEKERLEKERLEKEKLEKERLEKKRLEKETLEKPSSIHVTLEIDIIKAFNSCVEPIEITRWIYEDNIKREEIETIYVDIEKGIDDNEIILLENKGHIINKNNKGDIKIYIKIINNTCIKRSGLDLIYIKNITLKESLCGFNFNLDYIDGNSFQLINKKGNIILSDTTKIIPNMGMKRNNVIGNLIIKFYIDKTELSLQQVNDIERIL